MARRKTVGSGGEDDRLERIAPPVGYSLGKERRMSDVLAMEAELLKSEGLEASPEGDRPFLRRLDLASGRTTELWRSAAPGRSRVPWAMGPVITVNINDAR